MAVQCTQAVLPTRLTYATFYIFSHMYSQTIIPTRTIGSLRLKICGGKVFDILANSFARPFLNFTGMAISKYGEETRNQRLKNVNIRLAWRFENRQAACRIDPRYRRTFMRTLVGEW